MTTPMPVYPPTDQPYPTPAPMPNPAKPAMPAAPMQPVDVPPTFQPQAAVPLPAYEQQLVADTPQPPAPVQIPKGGYAQRFVTVPLPTFNLPGIDCQVKLRNPGMMAHGATEDMVAAVETVELDDDGEPVNKAQAFPMLHRQLLGLIAAWTMWDATSPDDNPPLLPSPPASIDDLKRAPSGAIQAILAAVAELQVPQ
ncbi:hypothetical protein ABIA32_002688 [Streptacidiphilus sp. MAP12-20]|uniref:hypothetical protein n=1 Tax=Streptacidiphilus sp. MAP12-20 TaxID=3156299 RepID=UPI0035169D62